MAYYFDRDDAALVGFAKPNRNEFGFVAEAVEASKRPAASLLLQLH
jgi:hypothetical protein